jgi:ferrous iron transport protein A
MKSLLEIPAHTTVKIVSVSGGKRSRQMLTQMGISIGSLIKIKRNAPFAGPLLLENHGAAVAIGRGVAARIMVEEI